jgi:hypothetical protein
MNPRLYLQLFNREARLFLAIGFGLGALLTVVFGVAPARHSLAGIVPLIICPVFVGVALGRTVLALETRPPSLLVPGLRHQLWRWNSFVSLALAVAWGCIFKVGHPDLPLLVLVTASAALLTAPIVIYPKRVRWITVLPLWSFLWLSTFLKKNMDSRAVELFLADHQLVIGVLSAAITGWQLRAAGNTKRMRSLGLALREETSVMMEAESDAWFRAIRERFQFEANLGQRRQSVRDWVAAIQLERPGIGYRQSMILIGLVMLILMPLLSASGGYPRAWYLMVFSRDEGVGPLASVVLWMSLIPAGLFVPLPRCDVLYPIPRRMRARVAFWSSAGTWLAMLAVWIGGALLLASVAGWWSGQPLSAIRAVRFAAPAVVALPTLCVLRWARLRYEGRSEASIWAVCLLSFPLNVAGWVILSVIPPGAAMVLAAGTTAVSLASYALALHEYFTGEDLIQPGPAKPMFRMR